MTSIQWLSKFRNREWTTIVPAPTPFSRLWMSRVRGMSCWPQADVACLHWGLKPEGGSWDGSQEGFPQRHLTRETITFVSEICWISESKIRLHFCVSWAQRFPKAKGLIWQHWGGLSVSLWEAVIPVLWWEGPALAFPWYLQFFHFRISHFWSGQFDYHYFAHEEIALCVELLTKGGTGNKWQN